MSHGKETPRQKMIGMMYLFLTSMLALNVSKSVLHSFILVNDSLVTTVENFNDKNSTIYDEFDRQAAMNAKKVGKWKEIADEIHKKADELSDYIGSVKVKVVATAEGPEAESIHGKEVVAGEIEQKDNLDVSEQLMIVQGGGEELKEKLEEYRSFLISKVDKKNTSLIQSISKNLDTSDPPKGDEDVQVTWADHIFAHMPMVAAITMLTKLQSDVRNAEADVLRYLYGQISAQDYKFNSLEAVVIPKSNYVLTGGKYEAKVFVAAQDTTQQPRILIGDYTKNENGIYEMTGTYDSLNIENGKGIFSRAANRVGDVKWGGLIVMKAPDGSQKQYPFKAEYKVEKPTAVISASANRVFYFGVPNPLEISVPGLRKDQITPRATNARIVKYKGGYAVKPNKPGGKIKISVIAKIDDKTKMIGSNVFSVKRIPKPTPFLFPGKYSSGTITKDELLFANKLGAVLEGFIMENIKYTVTGFTVSTVQEGGFTVDAKCKGAKISSKAVNLIKNVKRGDRITIDAITAKGPDGKKELSPLVFKIK